LQNWATVEAVVDAGDGGAPHQDYDAELCMVSLVGLCLDFGYQT
jgi:hypothetical protein